MADVSPVPFINFGLSQAQQGQATAAANAENAQANLTSQQAQQAGIETQLMQRSMPIYNQAIDDARAAMGGNPVLANGHAPTGYEEQSMNASGAGATPGAPATPPPSYTDPGQIAQYVKQQNYVEPFTPQEQRLYYGGAALAALPGKAANPMLANMAKLQNQFRTTNQAKLNALRSNQLYDALTAVQDPDNQHPFSALAAVPGQGAIAAKIAADHPNDPQGRDDAARLYAQMAAYNYHQYTGYPTKLENGVEIDTERGAPVTGQQQVRTGLTVEDTAKIYADGYSEVKVPLKNGETATMMKWRAPAPYGWGGITPAKMVAQENATALRRTTNPNAPPAGATTWNAPDAAGNQPAAAAAVKQGTISPPAPTPNAPPVHPAQVAVGQHGQAVLAQQPTKQALDNVPSPTKPFTDLPAAGTQQYATRMQLALNDKKYDSQWSNPNLSQPGLPVTGAKHGIANYQNGLKALAQDQSEVSSSADTALQNFQAAKQIFDSTDGIMTGPVAALEQKVAALTGADWRTVDGRQEIAKYLTQAAVAQLKQMYGSRPAAFDVKINLDQAFPNVDKMSPQAVRNLIDSQISQAQYLKDSAGRAALYMQKGKDPYQFGTWNATYFPRSHLLDSMYGQQQPPQGAETRDYQGDSYYLKPGTDRTKRENWVKYKKVSNG